MNKILNHSIETLKCAGEYFYFYEVLEILYIFVKFKFQGEFRIWYSIFLIANFFILQVFQNDSFVFTARVT